MARKRQRAGQQAHRGPPPRGGEAPKHPDRDPESHTTMKNPRKRKNTAPVRLSKACLDKLVEEAIHRPVHDDRKQPRVSLRDDRARCPGHRGARSTDVTGRDRRRVPSCRHPPDRSTPRSPITVTATGRQRVDRRLSPLATRRLTGCRAFRAGASTCRVPTTSNQTATSWPSATRCSPGELSGCILAQTLPSLRRVRPWLCDRAR